jgi:serine/threonine protein kinase
MRKEDPNASTELVGSPIVSPSSGGALTEDPETPVKLNGRYEIETELGHGGVGVVYLAHDKQMHSRPVVVKVLLEKTNQDPYFKKKFYEEIEALCRLSHPGIVDVLDKGEMPNGQPFFVMEFIEGVKLRLVMNAEGMDLGRVANIIRQVGKALSAAHEKNIWHRDLKPENIMLQFLGEGEEHVKLIDFGIATIGRTEQPIKKPSTQIVGTVPYMAPEQLQGQPTAASDIYALGVIAYEMLTGHLPFVPPSPFELLELQRAGVQKKPREHRPDLPETAQAVILKALSFNAEDRYSKARDFGESLGQTLNAPPNAIGKDVASDDILLESGDGAVPLGSPFYVTRPVDQALYSAIAHHDSIVLLKGARQMGKTSLLARGLQRTRESETKVVLTDCQKLNAVQLESVDKLLLAFAGLIADQLDVEVTPEECWNERRGPSTNFERYLRREVLNKITVPVVWGLDEVDRLSAYPYASEVFGLFRSWHNERQLDPSGPWQRLTLVIVYATEAHLLITDQNQSPFNVGTRLKLEDFSLDQVAELNRLCGSKLANEGELERYFRLVGGHPYLVRRGLYEMATHRKDLSAFEAEADRDEGPYGDHLRRIALLLNQNSVLREAVRAVLAGNPCPSPDSFYKLRSAGVLSGESSQEAKLRCNLYIDYLSQHLVN